MIKQENINNFGISQAEIDEEKELIIKVQQGDRLAFNQLMLRYQRQVFNIAFRIFGDYHLADETAQDVFVCVFKSIRKFKFNSKFFTWLYRIIINLSRNKIKKNVRDNQRNISLDEPFSNGDDSFSQRDIPDTSTSADKDILDKELNKIIQAALNSLQHDFREIIVLRDIQQLSYEQISQILLINLGTVKSRLHRARGMLADILEEVM